MPKTRIFIQDAQYYGSLSGNPIKVFNPKRHVIVSPAQDQAARNAFIAARDARLAEERAKLPRGPGSRGGKPPLPGIRKEAKRLYDESKERAAELGDPRDGAADINTARMIAKLYRHDPAIHKNFADLAAQSRSHYFRYNSRSHSIEMYNHRQVYNGSFQLPAAIRSKKSAKIYPDPTHYLRSKYAGGTTRVYQGDEIPIQMMPHRDLTRGPLATEYRVRGPAPRETPQQRLARIDDEFYGPPDVFGVRTILVGPDGEYIPPDEHG